MSTDITKKEIQKLRDDYHAKRNITGRMKYEEKTFDSHEDFRNWQKEDIINRYRLGYGGMKDGKLVMHLPIMAKS